MKYLYSTVVSYIISEIQFLQISDDTEVVLLKYPVPWLSTFVPFVLNGSKGHYPKRSVRVLRLNLYVLVPIAMMIGFTLTKGPLCHTQDNLVFDVDDGPVKSEEHTYLIFLFFSTVIEPSPLLRFISPTKMYFLRPFL